MEPELEIAKNRQDSKYSKYELIARVLWGLIHPLFRYSPRICFGWRRFLLRCFGARVGNQVHVYASARIYLPWKLEILDFATIGEFAEIYNLGLIRIEERATISQRAHLCAGTHDYSHPKVPLLKPPILIGPDAWVCADAFVGPGVTVGRGAIVGARAVVMKNVNEWDIVSGNPAVFVRKRQIKEDAD